MPNTVIKTRVIMKRDTAANWERSDLVLLNGEMAFDESGKYKIGDGINVWTNLEYVAASANVIKPDAPTEDDSSYDPGTIWIDQSSGKLFILVSTVPVSWQEIPNMTDILVETNKKVDKVAGMGLSTNDYDNAAVEEVAKIKDKLDAAQVGISVASLDDSGKVPANQLPSYVDDVIEAEGTEENPTLNFPKNGESGKIYVDTLSNKTFRWSGSTYVEISSSLALGETSSSAFPGDRGKAVEDTIDTLGSMAFISVISSNSYFGEKVVSGTNIADGSLVASNFGNGTIAKEKLTPDVLNYSNFIQTSGDFLILDCGTSSATTQA